MLIFMHFTFQIILLGIGFGVGYWLLITANTQEDNLKILGRTLGGILIVMAIILAIFSCYYSMKIGNRSYMQSGCPVKGMMQRQMQDSDDELDQKGGKLQNNNSSQKMDNEENEGAQESSIENENESTKYGAKGSD